MPEPIFTRDDANLLMIRVVAAGEGDDFGPRVGGAFAVVNDCLQRRYDPELLNFNPIVAMAQATCISLALKRDEKWGVDDTLARLQQLEGDLELLVPVLEKLAEG